MSPAKVTIDLNRTSRRTALHFEGQDFTYEQLATEVDRTAGTLAVKKGERVAWLGYNHPGMLILLFALARLGGILVPLNWRLTAAEHRQILADCGPRFLLSDPEFENAARALDFEKQDSSGSQDGDLLIVYTSGTTGTPKGAVLTQAAVLWNARNSVYAHELTEADHVLTALPMFHVGGLNIQTLPALLAGATVTLHKRFDAGAWLADVEKRRPTLSLLVPAALQAVVSHPAFAATDLSSLRLLNTGSMVVPGSLIAAFHRRGVAVGQIYGATETAPIATALRREDAMRKPGSAGRPVPHAEVRIVEGEIQVRGPAVMRGYWSGGNGERSGLADGWFRSGDLARVDEEGFFWIVGRSKDVIISGGENIHPAELENVLADCPAIAEAAVIGVQDPKWGEAACAVVTLKAKMTEGDVLKLFENRLARYKHPRRVVFLDRLPRNAMGKVQKAELRRLVDAQLDGAQPL